MLMVTAMKLSFLSSGWLKGLLSICVALCYLDFRFLDEEWRKGRPQLAVWHDEFRKRESVRATQFQDEPRPA